MQRPIFAVFALLAWALIAGADARAATPATATASVNMRAGPGTGYPVVTTLPEQAALTVFGCTASTTWCDVAWGPNRGWVAATYIALPYQGRVTVLTPVVAPAVGVTVVVFGQSYWNTYYVGRPWYGHWHVYHRPAPPPPRRGAVVGCNEHGCAGAAVGPRRAAVGYCNDDTCRGAVVRRGPHGGVVVRRGSVARP